MFRDITETDPGRPGRVVRVLVTVAGLAVIAATVLAVTPRPAVRPVAHPTTFKVAGQAPPQSSIGLVTAGTSNYSSSWLVTGNANTEARLWKTNDSGVSWTRLSLPVAARSIDFAQIVDPNLGYLVTSWPAPGSGQTLSVTDDGGIHWEINDLPNPPRTRLAGITFTAFGEGRALFTDAGSSGLQAAYVYSTEDGRSWVQRSSVDLDQRTDAGLTLEGRKDGMAFSDAQHGFIASGEAGVYVTADGGSSWTYHVLVRPPGDHPIRPEPVTVAAVPGAFLIGTAYRAIGTPGSGTPAAAFVYRSVDGGETWSDPVTAPTDAGSLAPVFAGLNAWWIADRAGVAETDGHGSWNGGTLRLPGATTVKAVFPFDDRRAWVFAGGAAGMPQFLFATIDGGNTWSPLKPPA